MENSIFLNTFGLFELILTKADPNKFSDLSQGADLESVGPILPLDTTPLPLNLTIWTWTTMPLKDWWQSEVSDFHLGLGTFLNKSVLIFFFLTLFLDTTFVNFNEICSGEKDAMFITNPINEDLQHPVEVSGIKMINSIEQSKVFVHRPDVG